MLGDIKKRLRPWPVTPLKISLFLHTPTNAWNFDDGLSTKMTAELLQFLNPNILGHLGIPVFPTQPPFGVPYQMRFLFRVTFDRRWLWHCRDPADALRWRHHPIYCGDFVGQTSRYPKLAPTVGHEANRACKGHDIMATFQSWNANPAPGPRK